MAATIQQKSDLSNQSHWWENSAGKVISLPRYADSSRHPPLIKGSLWMDASFNRPFSVDEDLRNRAFALPRADLRPKSDSQHYAYKASSVGAQNVGTAFINSLRACTKNKDLHRGARIHEDVLKLGLLEKCSDALVTMYAKCGELVKAKELLDLHKSMDVITWTALIAGYAREGQSQNALDCFGRMQDEGIPPNAVTYACVLKACASLGATDKGRAIHDEVMKQGLLLDDIVLGNSIVDMYAKCGDLAKAQDVLEKLPYRDVVSWSTLIAGYAKEGQGEQALHCFKHMQREGIPPNAVTYACILKAYATLGALDKGEEIHVEVAKQGLLQNNVELGTALLDMYAKCGVLSKAQDVLDNLPFRDVVSWNALISGYAQEGQGEPALNCFERMQCEGIPPNAVTYACILKACASIGAADKGKEIHEEVVKQGLFQDDITVGNAIVDMYAKCGALLKAQEVLEKLPSRDVVSWNALITGFAQEGQGEQALHCFERMHREGIPPDAVTFLSVLNVCSHLGLVEEGFKIFVSMNTKYGVSPSSECFTCVVDLFGRAGHLQKAVQLIQEMPSFDCAANWIALLGACRKWGDVEVGRLAYEQVAQVSRMHGPASILMADIYAAAGTEQNAKKIEVKRNKTIVKKKRRGILYCTQKAVETM